MATATSARGTATSTVSETGGETSWSRNTTHRSTYLLRPACWRAIFVVAFALSCLAPSLGHAAMGQGNGNGNGNVGNGNGNGNSGNNNGNGNVGDNNGNNNTTDGNGNGNIGSGFGNGNSASTAGSASNHSMGRDGGSDETHGRAPAGVRSRDRNPFFLPLGPGRPEAPWFLRGVFRDLPVTREN